MKTFTRFCLLTTLLLQIFPPVLTTVNADPVVLSDKDRKQADSETKLGKTLAEQVAKDSKFSTDKTLIDRVNTIGQKIAAIANTTKVPAQFGTDHVYPFVWDFHVIEDKDVNAFALPGGHVYVNTGLLNFVRSDDELAGVLGHEITHAAHHHASALAHEQSKMGTEMALGMIAALLAHMPAEDIAHVAAGTQYTQMGIMNTHYSEHAEQDADHGGAILMQKAGYNPVGMLTFMQRLAEQETHGIDIDFGILTDHPYTKDRVASITANLATMNVAVTPAILNKAGGASRFIAAPDGPAAYTISLGDVVCAKIADYDGKRSKMITVDLNNQLDAGLKIYQVTVNDNRVLVKDVAVLTITPADAALYPGLVSPNEVAKDVYAALDKALYRQSFALYHAPSVGSDDKKAEDAPSTPH